jgi:transposase
MMGKGGGDQSPLFYSFNLNEHIPADHLLRGIDGFLDLQDLRRHLTPFYSHTGRPSVDPELMVRMLLVGYCFGIRSERRLCEEVHLNLAYRWFCRLGLEAPIPDHSTFSKNRHGRFRESDVFRHVFEGVVQRCMAEGLVRGEGFAIDASVVKADANRQRGVPSEQPIDWSNPGLGTRAVQEYLQGLEQVGQVGATPMNISLTDPAARWTAAPGGPAFYKHRRSRRAAEKYQLPLRSGPAGCSPAPSFSTISVRSSRSSLVAANSNRMGRPADHSR